MEITNKRKRTWKSENREGLVGKGEWMERIGVRGGGGGKERVVRRMGAIKA